MDYTLIHRLRNLKINTVDTTVATAEADVLIDELTDKLLAAKGETLAYSVTK